MSQQDEPIHRGRMSRPIVRRNVKQEPTRKIMILSVWLRAIIRRYSRGCLPLFFIFIFYFLFFIQTLLRWKDILDIMFNQRGEKTCFSNIYFHSLENTVIDKDNWDSVGETNLFLYQQSNDNVDTIKKYNFKKKI